MKFITITPDKLDKLRDGLDIIEHLGESTDEPWDLYLYGITSNAGIVDSVKESIAGEIDEEETDIKIAPEVALVIGLSSDILYYLTGSGLNLRNEDVAYTKGEGHGVNIVSLLWASYRPKITISAFSTLAISRYDMYVDSFLQKYGNKGPAQAPAKPQHPHTEVTREGTTTHTPRTNEPEIATPTPKSPKVTSSLHNSEKQLVDPQLVKEFLD